MRSFWALHKFQCSCHSTQQPGISCSMAGGYTWGATALAVCPLQQGSHPFGQLVDHHPNQNIMYKQGAASAAQACHSHVAVVYNTWQTARHHTLQVQQRKCWAGMQKGRIRQRKEKHIHSPENRRANTTVIVPGRVESAACGRRHFKQRSANTRHKQRSGMFHFMPPLPPRSSCILVQLHAHTAHCK